jgi:hypothetical protein
LSVIDEHFSEWLGASPCRFARVFAGKKIIRPVEIQVPLTAADVTNLDVLLDALAAANQVGLVLWPLLRSSADVVSVLRTLIVSSRWKCHRVPWGKHSHDDATQVGLTWKTPLGDASSVMGFAPLGSMPVTRRSPYVAIAVWPGGRENPKHPSPAGEVGFIDCKVPEASKPEHNYDNLFTLTNKGVLGLLGAPPPDDHKTLRKVAFCLPSGAVEGMLSIDADLHGRSA